MADQAPIKLSDEQIAWLKGLKMSARAAKLRDHILEHGSITTEELRDKYHLGHPPRARGDLQDAGVGVGSRLVTVGGRRMSEYYFTGEMNKNGAGRAIIPKSFSDKLKKTHGFRCAICSGVFSSRELQADHRVPFMISGDNPSFEIHDFMPLCASCNRAKSWSCENCPNRKEKSVDTCKACFWAHPESYDHVETRPERRVSLIFQGDEVGNFDDLVQQSRAQPLPFSDFIKKVLTGF